MFSHILLEVFCGLSAGKETAEETSCLCQSNKFVPAYECLLHGCPHVSFTSCENTICYIGEHSAAEELISFGGEMETVHSDPAFDAVALWREISVKKVNEAYDEFMERAKSCAERRLNNAQPNETISLHPPAPGVASPNHNELLRPEYPSRR